MIEVFIAYKYLRSKTGFAKIVTWFSFIGIALGVATLIIVTSVMNGFRGELLDKIVGMKGHIEITSFVNNDLDNYNKLKQVINNTEIDAIISEIEKQVVILSNENAFGILVYGLSKDDLISKKLVYNNIVNGDIKEFYGNKIFIGKRLAETLSLNIGDNIKCLIPDGIVTAFGKVPKEEEFEIVGIFEVGMSEYDKNIILMPLSTAQDFLNMEGKVTKLEIFVKNVDKVNKVTKYLSNNLPNNLRILDWQHSDSSLFHAVKIEKNVMSLILSIIILVAAFNIISGLTMLTTNKIKDIAILRTIGMTKISILKIFLYIGSTIGIFGIIFGSSIGLLVALNVNKIQKFLESLAGSELFSEELYFLSQLPAKVKIYEVIYIIIFALITCFVATLYPAIKASKSDPIKSLKF